MTYCECDNFDNHGIDGCDKNADARLCPDCNRKCHRRIQQRLVAVCACGWKGGTFDKPGSAADAYRLHAMGGNQ